MAQSYADFKAYVVESLWRKNDVDLNANLDKLIKQANTELEQMTRSFDRRTVTTNIAAETQDYNLTVNVPDFQAVESLTNNGGGFYSNDGPEMRSVLQQEIYAARAKQSSPAFKSIYCVNRDNGVRYLRLVGNFSAQNPSDLQMVYRAGIPDYINTDTSWLEDEYLNLYLYTILKHCALFLREDDRIQLYGGMQSEAFQLADEDDKHNLQFSGSPLYMRPHHYVP